MCCIHSNSPQWCDLSEVPLGIDHMNKKLTNTVVSNLSSPLIGIYVQVLCYQQLKPMTIKVNFEVGLSVLGA